MLPATSKISPAVSCNVPKPTGWFSWNKFSELVIRELVTFSGRAVKVGELLESIYSFLQKHLIVDQEINAFRSF